MALFRGAVEGGFAGGCEAVGVNTEGEQDAHEGRVTWERRGGGGGQEDECHYSDKMHLREGGEKGVGPDAAHRWRHVWPVDVVACKSAPDNTNCLRTDE